MSRTSLKLSMIALCATFAFAMPSFAANSTTNARQQRVTTAKKTTLQKTRTNWQAELASKVTTADKVVKRLPGKQTYMQIGHGDASVFTDAAYTELKKRSSIFSADKMLTLVNLSNNVSPKIFTLNKPIRGRVYAKALFIGGNNRDIVNAGHGELIPIYLSKIPKAFRERTIPIDVALIKVSPPDKDGYMTLGSSTGVARDAMKAASFVAAEINANVPVTNGAARVHISEIDKVVYNDAKLKEVPSAKIGKNEERIAGHMMKLFKKRLPKRGIFGTFQFGIGGVPDAVAAALVKSKRKVRVRSEMISDGVMKLEQAGLVDGTVDYTFFMGTEKGLRWLHNNDKLLAYTTEEINNPATLGEIDNFVAVNAAVEVDTFGQVNAQMINDKLWSGVGGQVDFMRGAKNAKNGMAVIALPSTATLRNGEIHSKIAWPWALGPEGKGIKFKGKNGETLVLKGKQPLTTTSLHDLSYVVTEHGVAEMSGELEMGLRKRVENLIKVADPRFRPLMRELYAEYRRTNEQAAYTKQAKINEIKAVKKAEAAAKRKAALTNTVNKVTGTVAALGKNIIDSRVKKAKRLVDKAEGR